MGRFPPKHSQGYFSGYFVRGLGWRLRVCGGVCEAAPNTAPPAQRRKNRVPKNTRFFLQQCRLKLFKLLSKIILSAVRESVRDTKSESPPYTQKLRFLAILTAYMPICLQLLKGCAILVSVQSLTVQAYAKINLSLNITGVQDHMHTVDMIVASVDIADVVSVSLRPDKAVNVRYSGAEIKADGTDSVNRAVAALRTQYPHVQGADICIQKNIPMCAGLGGSSVDAAAVLYALDKLLNLTERGVDIAAAALATGSDVPYMLQGGFARVSGTGGRVEHFSSAAPLYAVIAQGAHGVLTGQCYGLFDTLYPQKMFAPSDNTALTAALKKGDSSAAYTHMDNALTAPAVKLNPQIAHTLNALKDAGAQKALLTGSGSACTGFFPDLPSAQAAAQQLQACGLWARAVQLIHSGIKNTVS